MKTYFRFSHNGFSVNKYLVVVKEGEWKKEYYREISIKGKVVSKIEVIEGDNKERLWLVTEGEVELREKIEKVKKIEPLFMEEEEEEEND